MTAVNTDTDARAVLRSLPSDWTVVHDGTTPGTLDVDHVVVGPGGIFLVSVRDRPGPAYALYRAVDTAACSAAADVVADMAGPYARRVRPLLCIVGDAELLEQALDVLVCSTVTLATALTSAPLVLTEEQADEAVALLVGEQSAEETAPLAPVAEPLAEPVAGSLCPMPRGASAPGSSSLTSSPSPWPPPAANVRVWSSRSPSRRPSPSRWSRTRPRRPCR